MSTTGLDPRIAQVASLLHDYEQQRRAVTGSEKLADALSTAAAILSDSSEAELHETVLQLVRSWFERVRNWTYLALSKPTLATADELRIQLSNINLFDDPIFGLPRDAFDRAGLDEILVTRGKSPAELDEMLAIMRKPSESRTESEWKYWYEFVEASRGKK